MPTLTQLSYIVAVAKHRNFGVAADHCFVTQPTLSMQIKKLEEELEVDLFDRTKQPVVPTETGARIIEQARIVLRETTLLQQIADDSKGLVMGDFQLGVIPTLSPYLTPLFIRRFSEKYPKVSLRVKELQTTQIIEALKRDEIDAGIAVTPLDLPGIVEDPLFYESFYFYAPLDHPFLKQERVDQKDLNLNEVWLLSEGHCFRDQVIQLCSARASAPSDSVRFESGSLETLKALVEGGYGVTLIPHLAALQLKTETQRAMLRSFNPPIPTREVSLLVARTVNKQATLKALRGEIIAGLPSELQEIKDHGNVVPPLLKPPAHI